MAATSCNNASFVASSVVRDPGLHATAATTSMIAPASKGEAPRLSGPSFNGRSKDPQRASEMKHTDLHVLEAATSSIAPGPAIGLPPDAVESAGLGGAPVRPAAGANKRRSSLAASVATWSCRERRAEKILPAPPDPPTICIAM